MQQLIKIRLSLFAGIMLISVFPVLIKMELASGLISAFYRMAIASLLLLPFGIFSKKLKRISLKDLLLTMLCGAIFASDVTVWNISIQKSTATQATLLTNLSPMWVGVFSLIFLKIKPVMNFWIGMLVAFLGMVLLVGIQVFLHLSFDLAFGLAILSGVLYAIYFLISKKVLSRIDVFTFITYSTLTAAFYLGGLSFIFKQVFFAYSSKAWIVFVVQGVLCQLAAWLLIGYAIKHMRSTRVSISMLGQALFTAVLAALFLGETITQQMIIGGILILVGIYITFHPKQLI